MQSAQAVDSGPSSSFGWRVAGGAGEVWEAVLHGPGGFRKSVALKLLAPWRVPDAEAAAGLMREARLGALLSHPNVVGTLGVAEHLGVWAVALELVRGASLAEVLSAVGPFPARAVLEVGIQAANGLAHAHELRAEGVPAGLVHRDVKPGNLLLDETGFVKVADLGISLVAGESVAAAGTPGYLAPEQVSGSASPASDVFSLAVTLYVLATASRPFGRAEVAVAAAERVEELLRAPAFLGAVEGRVPGLGPLLGRCFRADPTIRPTARELAGALARLRARAPEGATLLQLLAQVRPDLVRGPAAPSDEPTRILPLGNLRAPRDAFVGRREALHALDHQLREAPGLVVVLGPGGAGKTRLAFEAARMALGALPGGVWAFDLAEARGSSSLCAAIASGLEVELSGGDPAAQLGRIFAGKGRALVMLDNLEQVVEALPETLGRWLVDAPDVTFLGTSRAPTGLSGERLISLGGLSLAEAITLFRARSSAPIPDADLPELSALCESLDRMPLPLELAAARMRLLGLSRICQRLTPSLLTGGSRELPARQRSVVASLEWSVSLLSEEGRRALTSCSVFESGFTLEAAEAVLDVPSPLTSLQELVDASLVWVDRAQDRFGLLSLVRAHLRETAPPAERVSAERRHAQWFAQLGSPDVRKAVWSRGGAARREALVREQDELRVACERAAARGEPELALRLLAAFGEVVRLRGPAERLVVLASCVAAMPVLSLTQRAECDAIWGDGLRQAGQVPQALLRTEQARTAFAEGGDAERAARVEGDLGVLYLLAGRRSAARRCLEGALASARAGADRGWEGICLGRLGTLERDEGHEDESIALMERAVAVLRESEHARSEGWGNLHLGNLFTEHGRREEAKVHLDEALRLLRAAGSLFGEAVALSSIAEWHEDADELERARALFLQAAGMVRDFGDLGAQGDQLMRVARVDRSLGRRVEAVRGLEAAAVLLEAHGRSRSKVSLQCLRALLALDDGDLPAAGAWSVEAERSARSLGSSAHIMDAVATRAEVAAHAGRHAEARTLLVEAASHNTAPREPRVLLRVRALLEGR